MNISRRMIAVAVTATTAVAMVVVAAPGASAAPSHKSIPDTTPKWLDSAGTVEVGAPSAAAPVTAKVYLAPQGGLDALKASALAVSTPGSATYHQFVTPDQYRSQFGPTADEVATVESYLASAGLAVTGVETSNRYIAVAGTVAAAQQAFGVSIQDFDHDGQQVQAPTSDVTLPDSIADSVLTVTGLDTTAQPMAPPPAGFRNARPCSIFYGQIAATLMADFRTPLPAFNGATLPYAPCGYTGPQFRAAYEGDTALDGSGVTVAITDAYASPNIATDASTYAVQHGDGAYGDGQFSQVVPGSFNRAAKCAGASGWYGEETLDVEAVHAMAPAANIRYYASASCFDDDFIDTLNRVVDDDQVQLVSNSWGDVEEAYSAGTIAAYEQAFLQGTEEGISFLFSSGDDGDELAHTALKQADYPTSDPYVTSVGGTATAINIAGKLTKETGWGTMKYTLSANGKSWKPAGFLYGSGGGSSALFNQPAYQAGTVPGAARGIPDVAMDADPTTGMLIGITQTFPTGTSYGEYRIGGTSLASPLFAGMTALTLQHGAHGGLGLLNPLIYGGASSAFRDVTGHLKDAGNVRVDYANGIDPTNGLLYSVRTFDQDSSLKVTKGWDFVTGLGSPTSDWLTAVP
jgi:subtilase family serine protease